MTDAFKQQGKENVFHGVKNSDGKKPEKINDAKYADAPFVDDGKTLEDVKQKFAPNSEKPTSASADKGQKKLPEIMQKVDPQKKAQVIPEMYKQMQQLRNVLNAGAASGGGGGGGGSPNPGQNNQGNVVLGNSVVSPILEDALTAAFVNNSKIYSFERVIEIILGVLENGGVDKIDTIYRQVVINATINFIKMALYYGPKDIPVSTYELVPPISPLIIPPPNVVDIKLVPDMYVRQWYVIETNPYPSYIEWESPDGLTKVYTINDSKYYFESSSEEIFYTIETGLTEDLMPYFAEPVFQGVLIATTVEVPVLTPRILSDILNKYSSKIEIYNIDTSLGKNTGQGIANDSQGLNNQGNQGGGGGGMGGLGSMMGMLQGQLGGKLKDHMQNIMQKQLPKSVNDKQKINKNIQLSTQDMANNKKGFDAVQKMFGQDSNGGVGGMNLQDMMKGFQSGGGGTGAGGGGSGAGGGSSGGGGGGAGSGIPSGSGPYTGGDVSNTGLTQISSLLSVLGVS